MDLDKCRCGYFRPGPLHRRDCSHYDDYLERLLDERPETEEVVHPLHVLLEPEQLWRIPVLLQEHHGDPTKRRIRWFAARIEAIDSKKIYFLAGAPTAAQHRLFRAELSREAFDRASEDESSAKLEPGRFFEAGEYGDTNDLVIRVHPVLRMTKGTKD